jgi:hypothetical protein
MYTSYDQVEKPKEIFTQNAYNAYQSLNNIGVNLLSDTLEDDIAVLVRKDLAGYPQPLQQWVIANINNLVDDLVQSAGDAFQVALHSIGISIMSMRLATNKSNDKSKETPCKKGFSGLFCRFKRSARDKADVIYDAYCKISDQMIASHNESRSPRAIREMKLFELQADEIERKQAQDKYDREQKVLITGILTGTATDVQIKKFLIKNIGIPAPTQEQIDEYRTALSFMVAKGKDSNGKKQSFGIAELMLALMQSRGARF